MIQILVCGVKGRMGRRLVDLIVAEKDLELTAGVDVDDRLEDFIGKADVVIDFTVAAAAAENAAIAAEHGIPIVIGTTGLSAEERMAVVAAARRIPVILAPNMSVGVSVMARLVAQAARALGTNYRIDIVEAHHAHKLDRPSGTAKRLAEAAAEGGQAAEAIPIRSIREGEIVGDHTVTFSGPAETLAISHHALSRDIFAEGALAAARWIAGKPAGLYTMDDVLELA